MQVSLHVVYVDAAVSRRATSVVPAITLLVSATAPQGTQEQDSDELVEVQEEGLLHNDSLRREYGEECVSVEEDADIDAFSADDCRVEESDKLNSTEPRMTDHTPASVLCE